MKYSQPIRNVHRILGNAVTLEQLARIAEPSALGLNKKADFYEPTQFSVRIGAPQDVAGVLRFAVPVVQNENWYGELKRRVATTIGQQASNLDVRTINGTSIERVPASQLGSLGHLTVYNNGVQVRLAKVPAVPIEFSATKLNALHGWIAGKVCNTELGDGIAKLLSGKEAHEIDEAISTGGAVSNLIRKHIESASSSSWQEFARIYNVDSPIAMADTTARHVLDRVTKHMLRGVRSYIKASSAQIQENIATQKSKHAMTKQLQKGNRDDAELFAPVLGNVTSIQPSDAGYRLFRSLMKDAFSSPQLQQAISNSIYRAPVLATTAATPMAPMLEAPIGDAAAEFKNHPWYHHVHETMLHLRGSYPSDYMARHTKQNLSATAPYVGDALQTYQRYHLYSGRLPVPPGREVRNGVLIECNHGATKGSWSSSKRSRFCRRPPPSTMAGHIEARIPATINCHDENEEGEAANVESKMPDLIPIQGAIKSAPPRLIPLSEIIGDQAVVTSKMPDLIPIQGAIKSAPPRLIPLSEIIGDQAVVTSKMPDLIPIQGAINTSAPPRLIPLSEIIGKSTTTTEINTPMPQLVPISTQNHHLIPLSEIDAPMPNLVPVNCHNKDNDAYVASAMPSLIPLSIASEMRSRLVPISSADDEDMEGVEAGYGFSSNTREPLLPPLEDLFK
jgi:hypothetical protein